MHVSMTQGVVSVDISLTREEAEHLLAILNYSASLWRSRDIDLDARAKIEETSSGLFAELSAAGIETPEYPLS
jgi:hypothetical protein